MRKWAINAFGMEILLLEMSLEVSFGHVMTPDHDFL
jgi:hypothetical protein